MIRAAFIATGFNRCYPDMVDLNDQGLRRQNALNDITETTGLVFLGLTIGCARCHDHKFDPIRQTDFYALEAFFTPARFRDDYPLASRGIGWITNGACGTGSANSPGSALADRARGRFARPSPGDLQESTTRRPPPWRSRPRAFPREVELVFDAWRDRRIKPADWASLLDPRRGVFGAHCWLD